MLEWFFVLVVAFFAILGVFFAFLMVLTFFENKRQWYCAECGRYHKRKE